MAACSMQLGLISIGVNYSATFDVSSSGGKYGQMRSTLNTRCRPMKGGILNSKALSPTTLVMVQGPY